MSAASCLLALLAQVTPPPLEEAWVAEFDDLVLGAPLVHGELVIVAPKDGKVAAFRLDSGEAAWTFDVKGPVLSPPVLCRDRLFVPSAPQSVVLDPKNGKVLREKAPPAARAIPGARQIYLMDGVKFEGGYRLGFSLEVAAYDPLGGRTVWKEKYGPIGVSAAVEAGNYVYFASQYHLYVQDARTGRVLHQATREDPKTPGVGYHAAADKEHLVFLPEKVMCYDPKTLKESWGAPVDGPFAMIPPLLVSDLVVVVALPDVRAFDPETGKDRWTVKLEGHLDFSWTPPAVRGSEVLIAAAGRLFSIDAAAGKAGWTLEMEKPPPPAFVQQPVAAGDRVLYTVGRRVICFKPK